MKNIIKHILCVFLCVSMLFPIRMAAAKTTQPASATQKPRLLGLAGRATLYRFDGVWLVNLFGTWEQMGQQYGALLKKVLNEHYTQVIQNLLITEKGCTEEQLKAIAMPLFADYPEYLQEFIKAAGKASGLGEEKMILLNAAEFYFSLTLPTQAPDTQYAGACSGVAAWGPYSRDGKLVFGRNYDFGKFYRTSASEFFAVCVCNPADGKGPIAFWGYAGCVYAVNGMNASGLFAQLNNGERSDPSDLENCTPGPVSLIRLLLDCKTMDQAERFFNTTRPECGYIINVATPHQAASFEWATYKTLKRDTQTPGFLVGTNHFKHTGWENIPQISDDDNSAVRMANALEYGKLQKGTFGTESMKGFLEIPVEQGGITLFDFWTSYQFVLTPEDKKLWIKVPNTTDWSFVPLGNYLKARPPHRTTTTK